MATTRQIIGRDQQYINLHVVRDFAHAIDPAIDVTLEEDEMVLRAHGVEERYPSDNDDDAIAALRASWQKS